MDTRSQLPAFVVSLDFELMWGVRDIMTKDQYGGNVMGARQAIPRMLDAFERSGVRATWATVGFLFCESKDELVASSPQQLPVYTRAGQSNYSYLDEVGADERSDPYYFGLSLIRRIAACPGQEVASHTWSHFYCLEDGVSDDDLSRDLASAVAVAARRGFRLKSLVFPRNQCDPGKLAVCRRHGIEVVRGTESHWLFRARCRESQQQPLRRGLRLADAYLNLSGYNTPLPAVLPSGLVDVPSSRYLRPHSCRLAPLEGVRLKRICDGMDAACQQGGVYHLWWHPHDFGRNLDENMQFLGGVLEHFVRLRDSHGMQSVPMGDFAGIAAS